MGFGIAFSLTMLLLISLAYLLVKGTGIWGINAPVGWGFAIINFVWWIGIGHAGTLISAILLLLRQEWRTSINRFAEAMTISRWLAPRSSPSSMRAVPGWPHTGCSPIPIRWVSGLSSEAPWSGTCSRFPPTRPSPCSSGLSD